VVAESEVDPAVQTTQMRGHVVDFTAQGPATPVIELQGLAGRGATPAPMFGTPMPGIATVPPAAPMAAAPLPSAFAASVPLGSAPAVFGGGLGGSMAGSVPVNPFATQAMAAPANPFAAAAVAPTASAVQVPVPAPGVSSGASTSTAQIEAAMRDTSALLRWIVEACIARGVFSREEYVARVRAQQ
jgi:hypothetical protein